MNGRIVAAGGHLHGGAERMSLTQPACHNRKLLDTDPLFGPVDKVNMFLGQRPLTVNGPTGPANSQYTGTIQFGSYDPPLEGDQLLTVRATNKHGTETVARRRFVSDNKGPTIINTIPGIGALIGRVITVSAQVSDPAGVLDSFTVGGAKVDNMPVVIADFFATLSEAVGARLDNLVLDRPLHTDRCLEQRHVHLDRDVAALDRHRAAAATKT